MPGSRSSAPPPPGNLDGHRHRPDRPRTRRHRAGAAHAAPDAADPPLRGEGRRGVRARQDRRVLPPLHRSGGGRRGVARGAAGRRLRHLLVSRARPGAGAWHRRQRGDGRAVRQGDGVLEGQGRLDAPVRRQPAVHGRPRDRRGSCAARGRDRLRDQVQGGRSGVPVLLRRSGRQHRRLPRNAQHGLRLQAPRRLLLREQPLRHGHGVRAGRGCDRRRRARVQLRHGRGARERHGPAGGVRGDGAGGGSRAQGRASHAAQKKRDPISQLALKLTEDGALDQAALDALDAEVRAEVEEAVHFADESPDPDPAELGTHVLAD